MPIFKLRSITALLITMPCVAYCAEVDSLTQDQASNRLYHICYSEVGYAPDKVKYIFRTGISNEATVMSLLCCWASVPSQGESSERSNLAIRAVGILGGLSRDDSKRALIEILRHREITNSIYSEIRCEAWRSYIGIAQNCVLSKELPKIVNANECFSKSDRLKIYTQYLYRMECFTNNYEDMQLAIGVIGDWFDGESDDENRMILDGVLVAVCQRHKVSVLRKEWLLRLARSPSRIDQYYSLHAGSNFFGVAHSNFVGSEIYVVQDGEDCYDVATKWNVTPADLKKMNKLKSADLSKGQVLKIPPPYLPRHIPVGSEQNSGGLVRP